MGGVIVLLVVIVLVLWVLASCIRIVPQAYAVVLERLGAYKATWSTGIHFKVPFIERVARRVNLKEQVVDFPNVTGHRKQLSPSVTAWQTELLKPFVIIP